MAALSFLTDILRILTPEEIAELTNASTGSSRRALTDLMDLYEDDALPSFAENGEGAKILPFNKKQEDVAEVERVYEVAGSEVCEYIEHFFHKKEFENTAVNKKGESVVTSLFILNEKERFKYVQSKLKKKEVMGLYMKNANVDIEQEKILKDDLTKSSRAGVLIDKKQY
ncbi:hypothetical protein [Bacteriovorax sp. Seq25_V]|uniref:hypothetical protein n=1 Tax=Bacteriovorax sp. Seq25_V TaxID=1201288 RepID=UPI00038A3C4F|nr:hypothetical protein [Bacteriovorax sp. Seq25_V]EQC43564.1 hypothetical protein M900_2754 [Bacteriovorax sp. Seq25_V]